MMFFLLSSLLLIFAGLQIPQHKKKLLLRATQLNLPKVRKQIKFHGKNKSVGAQCDAR